MTEPVKNDNGEPPQDNPETEESLLETVSTWAQRLFGVADETSAPETETKAEAATDAQSETEAATDAQSEIEAEPEAQSETEAVTAATSAKSEPSVAPETASTTEVPEKKEENKPPKSSQITGSWGDGADQEESPFPTFKPLSSLIPEEGEDRHLKTKPSRAFSLDSTQKSILEHLGFDSFERIAEIGPMDIIRVATTVNVPITDIENIWVPQAKSLMSQSAE